jgi:hypothetical protein
MEVEYIFMMYGKSVFDIQKIFGQKIPACLKGSYIFGKEKVLIVYLSPDPSKCAQPNFSVCDPLVKQAILETEEILKNGL